MNRKYILLLAIAFLVSMSYSISLAGEEVAYKLSVYLGEEVNLKSWMNEQRIDFIIDSDMVVQNFNANIISVNSAYILTAKDVGKSVLILSSGNKMITVTITVESPIESVLLESNDITLLLGEIYNLDFLVKHKAGHNSDARLDIKWTSDKPHVATIVNGNQVVTSAVGTTTFTGKSINGVPLVSFDLTVLGHPYKLKIASSEGVRTLNVGETLNLQAYFGTKDITNSIEWISLTPHVLSVDQYGVVTAIGEGSGEIKAKSSNTNNNATYKLDAYSMIDRVQLNDTLIKFKAIGQTKQLFFNLYPKDKNNPPIMTGYKYISSNNEVAVVSSNGLVTAKGPGIALISVVFDDSQKRASCTVEVPDNNESVPINYISVKNVELQPYNKTVLIGEKVLLDYKITPENASDQRVTFNISQGDDSQIIKSDGLYYFIPKKRGSVKIELVGADGKKDMISISVTSPINTLDLVLSSRRKVSLNEEKMYVGEISEVITKAYARTGYSSSDIYSSSLKYTIKDNSIAELIVDGEQYYVKALKAGKTELQVKNLEGLHEKTLWISVENPIKGISTDTKVSLPTNRLYRPRVSPEIIESVNNLRDSFVLNSMVDVSVNAFYLNESFIDEEIKYEEEYSNHQERLSQLKTLKNSVVDGYVQIYDLYSLKNRNGQNYNFYDVKEGNVIAYYPSKTQVKIALKNTVFVAESMLEWLADDRQFSMVRLNKKYTLDNLLNQFALENTLGDLPLTEQIDLFITYLNNVDLFAEKPNYNVLSSLSTIETEDGLMQVIRGMKGDVTRGDLAKLGIELHKKYIDKDLKFLDDNKTYYYDVIDPKTLDAISLNHVIPDNKFYFGTSIKASENDFYKMVKSILPYYELNEISGVNTLSFERLIVLLGNLLK